MEDHTGTWPEMKVG